jgi:hypothetical protein
VPVICYHRAMAKKHKPLQWLKKLPTWALVLGSLVVWGILLELLCFGYLVAIRSKTYHPITMRLGYMVDRFHPLFRTQGFVPMNFVPYVGVYHPGDWSKTPAPGPMHPDGWVLPLEKAPGQDTQPYLAMDKPKGTLRVIALGGSTMAGHGQSGPDKTIPATIERLLREANPGRTIEVINAAYGGHIAAQEMTALTTKLIAYHPDLIVVLDGYNEFVRVHQYPFMPPFWSLAHEQNYRTVARVQSLKGVVGQLAFICAKRFYTLALAWAVQNHLRMSKVAAQPVTSGGKPTTFNKAPYDRALEEYLMVHKTLLGTAVAHDVPIILAAQPTPRIHKILSDEEQEFIDKWDGDRPGFLAGAQYYFPELERRYKQFIARDARPGVKLLNLTGLFSGQSETLYVDSCHYNDPAAARIATALAPHAAHALGLKVPKVAQ